MRTLKELLVTALNWSPAERTQRGEDLVRVIMSSPAITHWRERGVTIRRGISIHNGTAVIMAKAVGGNSSVWIEYRCTKLNGEVVYQFRMFGAPWAKEPVSIEDFGEMLTTAASRVAKRQRRIA